MKPEDVLELMGTAPQRYASVRAALRYGGDGPTLEALEQRYFESETYRIEVEVDARRSKKQEEPLKLPWPDGYFGWRCRIWKAGRYYWRRELDLPGGGVDIAVCSGRETQKWPPNLPNTWYRRVGAKPESEDPWWLEYPKDHYWTFYLVDPDVSPLSFMLSHLELRVEDETEFAGREALRLVGRPVEEWEYDPDPLQWGADEYEALVDAERGIILRLANRLGGKDFDALGVEEVYFDEQFSEDVFTSREPLPWQTGQ